MPRSVAGHIAVRFVAIYVVWPMLTVTLGAMGLTPDGFWTFVLGPEWKTIVPVYLTQETARWTFTIVALVLFVGVGGYLWLSSFFVDPLVRAQERLVLSALAKLRADEDQTSLDWLRENYVAGAPPDNLGKVLADLRLVRRDFVTGWSEVSSELRPILAREFTSENAMWRVVSRWTKLTFLNLASRVRVHLASVAPYYPAIVVAFGILIVAGGLAWQVHRIRSVEFAAIGDRGVISVSQMPAAAPEANQEQGSIRWFTNLAMEGGPLQGRNVFTLQFHGFNYSENELQIRDAHLISKDGSTTLPLEVAVGNQLVPIDQINAIPGKTSIILVAKFGPPAQEPGKVLGLDAQAFLASWSSFWFVVKDNIQEYRIQYVEQTLAPFFPNMIGPRITKKDAADGK